MSGVFYAPVGTSLSEFKDWIPLGHTVDGFTMTGWADTEQNTWNLTETLAGRSVTFSFKARRRDIRRMIRMLNPASVRQSAMRREYRRRTKHR